MTTHQYCLGPDNRRLVASPRQASSPYNAMLRGRESWGLLRRLAALAEQGSLAHSTGPSLAFSNLLPRRQVLVQQLGQASHYQDLQHCSRLFRPGSPSVAQGRRLYQLVSLRHMTSGSGGAAEASSRIVSMMNKRLGKKAGDPFMYIVRQNGVT